MIFHLAISSEEKVYTIAHTMNEFLSYTISILGCISDVFEIDDEAEYVNIIDRVPIEIGDDLSNPLIIRDIKELCINLRKWNNML